MHFNRRGGWAATMVHSHCKDSRALSHLTCWCTRQWGPSRKTCIWSSPSATACPTPAVPAHSWCLFRSQHSLEDSSRQPLLQVPFANASPTARPPLPPITRYSDTISFHSIPLPCTGPFPAHISTQCRICLFPVIHEDRRPLPAVILRQCS